MTTPLAQPWIAGRAHDGPLSTAPVVSPVTGETIAELARSGVKRLAVIAPGFAADCLETLEELGVENRDHFLAHGGERFRLVPCLNDGDGGMDVIETVVRRELAGWIAG